MDCTKHILSGGFWKFDDEWVCASPNVLSVLKNMPIIQRHLGWVPPRTLIAGNMCRVAQSKALFIPWKDTQGYSQTNNLLALASVRWSSAIRVTAQSGDFCRKGSWVFVRDSEAENSVVLGRIHELLVPESCPSGVPNGLVILDRFAVSEACLASQFWHACTSKTGGCKSEDHHRCSHCGYVPFLRGARLPFGQSIQLLAHGDDDHVVINMAALHNGTLLRHNFPVALTVLRPLYLDREAHHHQVAIGLRSSQTLKRAQALEKRRATLKAKKVAQAGTQTSDEESNEEEDGEADVGVPQRKRQRSKK
ncbi:hypothetical protein B0H10DRAFT_1969369 [Mycena sp. CBHHK59/15]|nr:hypothetical protein B0H10DRAFT_1969369 [Mycena sp. CBHHK59/15]